MNRNISINVAKKLASVIGAPVIICGNSDYSITFTFDEEWETMDLKTARFVYKRDGALKFIDVVFSGRTTAVPVLSNIDEVYVGVYSGELHTTTPARIICKKSILCGDYTQHEAPDPDVYQQILEAFNNMETLPTVGEADAGRALMVNADGRWVVRLPDFMYDQNSGKLIRFFFGTLDEWNAWKGDKTGVLFCPTDDTTLEGIDDKVQSLETAVAGIKNGEVVVGKADMLAPVKSDYLGKELECFGLYACSVKNNGDDTRYTLMLSVESFDHDYIAVGAYYRSTYENGVKYNATTKKVEAFSVDGGAGISVLKVRLITKYEQ